MHPGLKQLQGMGAKGEASLLGWQWLSEVLGVGRGPWSITGAAVTLGLGLVGLPMTGGRHCHSQALRCRKPVQILKVPIFILCGLLHPRASCWRCKSPSSTHRL